ncbi:MAG: UDP-N-acetylmuramoyl-tripeptide--D-alanyl-D-alanine ligase [bacterium]|nr:UDP-N-acetylmuramoyl-tripeptide--D-alanyl-D-alanine ligase [bacterium]
MESITVTQIVQWTQGKLIHDTWGLPVTNISTDTRTLTIGDLFVPIKGEHFDGHNFLEEAIRKGAAGILIAEGNPLPHIQWQNHFVIQVKDTKRALGDLAKHYRAQFDIPVIAITGSNGKTTVKEMVAQILNQRFSVLKNEGNLNNEIGLPLTLFQLGTKHRVAVIELGMSALGEIKRLAEISQPSIGVVTNVAEAHLEFFKSVDEIAMAKSELVTSLNENHTAVLNIDDERVARFKELTKAKILTFGIQNRADFRATEIRFNQEKMRIEFQLLSPQGYHQVCMPILGQHNVYNALASTAAVWSLMPDIELIAAGLATIKPAKMRMELIELNGIIIINDAYNANPKSMHSALETIANLKVTGRKIAVLGTMRELGQIEVSAHQQVGIKVANLNLDYLITVGELARQIADGAKQAGMAPERIFELDSNQQAVEVLSGLIHSGDLVLVKASRKLKFEEIVFDLQKLYSQLCIN